MRPGAATKRLAGKFQLMLQRRRSSCSRRRRRCVCSSQLRRWRWQQLTRRRQQKVRREMQLKSFAVVAGDRKCHSPPQAAPRSISPSLCPRPRLLLLRRRRQRRHFLHATKFCAPFYAQHSEMPPPRERTVRMRFEQDANSAGDKKPTNVDSLGGSMSRKAGRSVAVCLSLDGRSVAVKNLLLFLHFRS